MSSTNEQGAQVPTASERRLTTIRTGKLSIVELYAGTARSSEPFRRWAKAQIALLIDNDEYAAKTYLHNHPRAPYVVGTLSTITPREIKRLAGGRVDILLGCPPCQGFSDTGFRDRSDHRNRHLTRFRLFAESLRPRAVAMENVPLAAEGNRFKAFVRSMQELGYRATWGIVNAALRGSAQCRHRLVYIAIHEDVHADPVIPAAPFGGDGRYFNYATSGMNSLNDDQMSLLSEAPGVRRVREEMPIGVETPGSKSIPCVRDIIDDLPTIDSPEARKLDHLRWSHTRKMIRRMSRVPEGGRWRGGDDHFSHSYGRLHRRGLARTITTFFSNPGSGRFWHPTDDRALSLREAARLQGFPDNFAFLSQPTRNCRLVGNALDRSVANLVYEVIRNALN
jgi:DNA (cytosine-5)-methyltransferase 1